MKNEQSTDRMRLISEFPFFSRRGLGRLLLILVLGGGLVETAPGEFRSVPPNRGSSHWLTSSQTEDPPSDESRREKRKKAYLLYTKAISEARKGNSYRAMEILNQVAELDPRSPVPHATLAEFQYRLRNTKEARREAEMALKIDPAHPGAHSVLGRIYRDEALLSGDRDKAATAIDEFRQVVERDETDIEAWYSLAQLYDFTDQQEKLIEALTRWTSQDPSAEQAFAILARHYFSEGKYREAAENASRALLVNYTPEHAILLARSLVAQGQTVEALRIYREARQQHPNTPELEVKYAEALMYAGQYEEAIAVLKRELTANGRDVDAVRLLAESYRRSGRRQEAIQTLTDGLRGIDVIESLDMQLILAQIYEEMGETDMAVQTYQNVLNVILNPDGSVSERWSQGAEIVMTRMGLAYRRGGQRQKAMRVFEEMRQVLGPTNPQPDLLIVSTLMDEHDFEEALEKAREGAGRFPDKREFRLLEAQIIGTLGRIDEAVKMLDGLMTNSFEDIDVLSAKAVVLIEAERYEEARKALEEGLRRDPRNNGLLIQLSMVREKLNQPDEAEATLRAILERDPDNPTVLNNLGYYLAERGERLGEALELTKRAVNIAPTEGSFLDSLGWVYFQLNQLGEAQHYLRQALDFKPRDATIHEHVGDLYLRQGRLDQARRSFERALEFSREREQIERLEQKLQKLK